MRDHMLMNPRVAFKIRIWI